MQIEKLQMFPVKMSVPLEKASAVSVQPTEQAKTFGEFLAESIDKTNQLQKNAENMNIALAAGKVNDISQVVVATAKAQLALELTMSIRNKAVDAYQEIMRMQV